MINCANSNLLLHSLIKNEQKKISAYNRAHSTYNGITNFTTAYVTNAENQLKKCMETTNSQNFVKS